MSDSSIAEQCGIIHPEEQIRRLGFVPESVVSKESPGLPQDSAARKTYPMVSGLLDYFPDALAEVAHGSWVGNEKHNPGMPLHHSRGKSADHADCIVRHLKARGQWDVIKLEDGRVFKVRHSVWVAWRALALLQEELEAAGAPLARGARKAEQ